MRRYGSGARGPGLLIGLACLVLFVVLLAYACGAGIVSGAAGRTAATDRAAAANSPFPGGRCHQARKGFVWYRAAAARWYRQMGARSRGLTAPFPRSCYELRYAAKRERLRARIARLNFEQWFRETHARWRCVHEREGAWNDDGAPYWGGLQFSWDFMEAYGPGYLRKWGHAGRWPIWAQLVTAERGRRARGFWPWPNTARECGLL